MEISRVSDDLVVEVHNQERAVILDAEDIELRDALEDADPDAGRDAEARGWRWR